MKHPGEAAVPESYIPILIKAHGKEKREKRPLAPVHTVSLLTLLFRIQVAIVKKLLHFSRYLLSRFGTFFIIVCDHHQFYLSI